MLPELTAEAVQAKPGGWMESTVVGGGNSNIPSKIDWDRIPTDPSVSCDRVIRYSGLGVRSVGPVGDFLGIFFIFTHT